MIELPIALREQIIAELDGPKGLQGWSSLDRALELAQLVLEYRPKVVCELGVYAGRSLIPISLALRHAGCGTAYGIDPWQVGACLEGENEANKGWWSNIDLDQFHTDTMKTIWRLGLEQIAIVIRARSQDVPQLFPEIQMLLIDANHSEVASCRDAETWVPRVVSGGCVAADDCDWPSTQKMQQIILESCDEIKSGENGHYKIFRKR